jgi:hypothetical protein
MEFPVHLLDDLDGNIFGANLTRIHRMFSSLPGPRMGGCPRHDDRLNFEIIAARFNLRGDLVCCQDAPHLLKWASEQIRQHCTVLHALKWTRQVVSVALNLHLDRNEFLVPVAQNDIDAITCTTEWKLN